jgi:hypothetical protein
MLYYVRFLMIKPSLHELVGGFESLSFIQPLGEFTTRREFNAANPVTASSASATAFG